MGAVDVEEEEVIAIAGNGKVYVELEQCSLVAKKHPRVAVL